ncbi:hypothetical protein E3P99_03930 [Wallemia hederae]|uniref:Uncharacterized protein n=1 Tax=Wallemia hederae TaxID=1540922 RepID=A0A4T0FCH5_9BASI|nr:hypothetical protein E3P99_03930 [Wallemia hederae]
MSVFNSRQNQSDGEGAHDKPSRQLYIIVFLIIIFLLLAVSSAIVLRTWYLRRRALRLGLDAPAQPSLFPFFTSHNDDREDTEMSKLGRKPEMYEVLIERDSTIQFDKQRPFAATISVPQSMTASLESRPSLSQDAEEDGRPGWVSAAARLALFSKPRSRFWPPVYRGRDAQYDRRQRLQALAELTRQRQEDDRQRRLQLQNPVKSLPPPIKENVTTPTVSLSMLVELPTKHRQEDELPDICIGLTETNLAHKSLKDVQDLVSFDPR